MSCTRCGGPTRLVAEYNQHWCDSCNAYVGAAGKKGPNYLLIIGLPVGLVVVALGIFMYMSISSFTSYVKKGKRSEAEFNLRAIAQDARTYYEHEHVPEGATTVVTGQIPGAAGPTPPLGTCCEQDGKCAPRSSWWDAPTWRALMFSVDDPHYYSYEFRPGEDGQSFTVAAYGDLDCDGDYSTFELVADPNEPISTAPIYREDELE